MAPISCQREADVLHKEKDTLLILLTKRGGERVRPERKGTRPKKEGQRQADEKIELKEDTV